LSLSRRIESPALSHPNPKEHDMRGKSKPQAEAKPDVLISEIKGDKVISAQGNHYTLAIKPDGSVVAVSA
jgi:hypothetical protein